MYSGEQINKFKQKPSCGQMKTNALTPVTRYIWHQDSNQNQPLRDLIEKIKLTTFNNAWRTCFGNSMLKCRVNIDLDDLSKYWPAKFGDLLTDWTPIALSLSLTLLRISCTFTFPIHLCFCLNEFYLCCSYLLWNQIFILSAKQQLVFFWYSDTVNALIRTGY